MHIYAIQNSANDKIYIGQHCGDDLQAYFRHNLRQAAAGRENKLYLYRAMRKHGPEKFSIKSLICPQDKEQMDRLEIFFIRTLDCRDPNVGYNITAGGGGRLGISRPHTDAEKEKIGAAHRGKPKSAEWAKAIGDAQRGRKFTEEHKAALRAGQLGKSKRRSLEHCIKISENKKAWWAKRKLEGS